MPTLHDIDLPLPLATALAAQRWPGEIVAATGPIQGDIPSADKLSQACPRPGATKNLPPPKPAAAQAPPGLRRRPPARANPSLEP